MAPTPPDLLKLSGAQQLNTFIEALLVSRADEAEIERFTTIRSIHESIPGNIDKPEYPLLSMQGSNIEAVKRDALTGLEVIMENAETVEQKMAAKALFDALME